MQPIISSEILTPVGKLMKPHGINGEITVLLTADVDLAAQRCVFLDVDGIYVPFFLNSVRPKSSETDLISIDGITDERQAATFSQSTLYALREEAISEECSEDGFYASDFVGFTVNSSEKTVGKIIDLDDTTDNYLFIIETPDGRNVMVPVADEYVVDIDTENRIITLDLPDGLLDI